MANPYYVHAGYPATGAPGASAAARAEFDAITAGFDKLPAIAGFANKALVVNGSGTGITTTAGSFAIAGDLTFTGAFATTFVAGAVVSLTLPIVSGTLATLAGTETLTNKTLGAVTLAGTVSGGGNQINNVVIGAVTPLAGTFTTLTSTGATQVQGNLSVLGTVGAITLAGTVSGGGNQINNIVIGAVTPLAGTFNALTSTGAAQIQGNLTVLGTSDHSNGLTVSGAQFTVTGQNGVIGGLLTVTNGINVTGTLAVTGALTVSTTSTLTGNVVQGANSWLTLSDTGSGNGRLIMTATGTLDFGGALLFRNAAGSTQYAQITSTGIFSVFTTQNGSAASGDIVIPNNRAYRGVNVAGTDTIPLIKLNTSNQLVLRGIWTMPAADGASGTVLQTNGAGVLSFASLGIPLRSYLAGLTMSTAGSSATMTIAPGQATDSTNADTMTLASSIGKTTSAWAVGTGNGGLDTGSISASTWYHFFLIKRPDTQVVDVLISLSATAPTMPTNYTLKRRIGSGKTNGSSQWILFVQDGDYFRWDTTALDVNTTNPGTAAVTATLLVPTGVIVFAIIRFSTTSATAGIPVVHISDLAVADEASSASAAPLGVGNSIGIAGHSSDEMIIRTNTSAQVRYRVDTSDGDDTIRIATLGWYDRRGKDA